MKAINKLLVIALIILAQNSFAQQSLDQACIDQINRLNQTKNPLSQLNQQSLNQQLLARAGHRGGNGGNSIASHFATIATNIAIVWEDICVNQNDSEAYCNYLGDFKNALNKDSSKYVTIKALEDAETFAYDGIQREAVNNGVDEIVVNSILWKEMIEDSTASSRRINLVVHEYFSVMELDSSDDYLFSRKVFGMLTRKGYDLQKLSAFEVLPSACSININSSAAQNELLKFEKGLSNKNYITKIPSEKTRFNLNLVSKCNDKLMSTACAVHVQIIDNYTNLAIKDSMLIDHGLAKKKDSILDEMNTKVLKTIKYCNAKK